MQQWEYLILKYNWNEETISGCGTEGWELVQIYNGDVYFKRLKQEDKA